MLPGTFARATAAAAAASLSYVTNTSNNPGGTSVSFAGVSIGTADGTRVVIIGIQANKASGSWGADPISSVVIGGVSATIAGSQIINSGQVIAIYYAAVPTGTTATITWTLAAAADEAFVSVYRAINLSSSTPTATANSTASPPAAALTINASGFGIGVAVTDVNGSSFSWTNLTEDFDSALPRPTISGASSTSAGSATRTATPGTSTTPGMCLAAWA